MVRLRRRDRSRRAAADPEFGGLKFGGVAELSRNETDGLTVSLSLSRSIDLLWHTPLAARPTEAH